MTIRPELIEPPAIVRAAEIPIGSGFMFAGRPLSVVKTYGTDPAAPVILEEHATFGSCIKGQLALWSYAAVFRGAARRALRHAVAVGR